MSARFLWISDGRRPQPHSAATVGMLKSRDRFETAVRVPHPRPRPTSPPAPRPSRHGALVFVYGTLRSGAAQHARLAGATLLDHGFVRGRLYAPGADPGAVLGGPARDRIAGEVFRLRRPVRDLAALDAYEGLVPEGEYRRVRCSVATRHLGRIRAWIYVYDRSVAGLAIIPGGVFSRGLAPAGPAGRARA